MPANAGRKPSYQHMDRNTTEPYIVVARIEKSTSGNSQYCITLYNIMHNFIQGSPDNRWKRVWITSSHKFAKVGLKMPRKLRQTNKSWGNYDCAIVWKNYLDRQIDRRRKGKIWPNVHTLPWELSQELQWDILCPRPIIWFLKNKNWPKDIRKAYGSRQKLLSSLGIKQSFKRQYFIFSVYYHIFYENNHVDLPILVNLG